MSPWLDRCRRVLMADKKKTAVMVALVAVGLLLWGRLLLKQVPKTATATPDALLGMASDDAGPIPEPSPRVVIDFPDSLDRDVFAIDPSHYQRIASENNSAGRDKSLALITDKQQRIEEVRRDARGLTLQSVVVGANPQAIVNGRLLQVGQSIEGFEVVEIHERSVIFRTRGVRIRLSL